MKFSWIVVSTVLLWSNFGRVHAQPIISDSTPTPLTSMTSIAKPTMEVAFESEREQNRMTSEKMSATVQAFTAERSDEAQPTTSLLSVEASSVPEPSMSITTQISMSMRGERQWRVGIITGGLAGGIAVLTFASIIAVLCHKTLQKRRNGQEGNKYRTKDHGMDIDDYDDIDDQQDTIDSSREPRQSGPSPQYLAGNHIPDDALTVQSFDVPPCYAVATLHRSLGPNPPFNDHESIITTSSSRSSASAPPAYGLPGYGDVVLSAR